MSRLFKISLIFAGKARVYPSVAPACYYYLYTRLVICHVNVKLCVNMDKRSSLFGKGVSGEGKRFYEIGLSFIVWNAFVHV